MELIYKPITASTFVDEFLPRLNIVKEAEVLIEEYFKVTLKRSLTNIDVGTFDGKHWYANYSELKAKIKCCGETIDATYLLKDDNIFLTHDPETNKVLGFRLFYELDKYIRIITWTFTKEVPASLLSENVYKDDLNSYTTYESQLGISYTSKETAKELVEFMRALPKNNTSGIILKRRYLDRNIYLTECVTTLEALPSNRLDFTMQTGSITIPLSGGTKPIFRNICVESTGKVLGVRIYFLDNNRKVVSVFDILSKERLDESY